MKQAGIIVARFQVPKLHAGHIYFVEEVLKRSDEVYIFLGCSREPNEKNPLPFIVRKEMILDEFNYHQDFAQFHIYPLYDKESDFEWSQNLDNYLDVIASKGYNVTLYGSRDSFIKNYVGKYLYEEIESPIDISGTYTRDNMEIRNNEDFRKGIIYTYRKSKDYEQ